LAGPTAAFCYDEAMRYRRLLSVVVCSLFGLGLRIAAQTPTGGLDVTARIAPTGGRPEPVRQFTFYILTRSYRDIQKDVAEQYPLADRETFISELKISPELKAWMKKHDVIDLMAPDTDKMITPEDVMNVPEFFDAYERNNSGGVTKGLPARKYRESDKETNPEKYEKQHQEFLAATGKFVQSHPSTITGMETELDTVNPKVKWEKALEEHNQKIILISPDLAQTKYLVTKLDTDLDGHLSINGLPSGNYWVSSLGMNASSGDKRLVWDVPVTVQAGKVTRVELSNLNARDFNSTRP